MHTLCICCCTCKPVHANLCVQACAERTCMQGLTLLGGQLWLGPFASHEASAPAAPELSVLAPPAFTVHLQLITEMSHHLAVVTLFSVEQRQCTAAVCMCTANTKSRMLLSQAKEGRIPDQRIKHVLPPVRLCLASLILYFQSTCDALQCNLDWV